jgi:chromosome segregation ATPase
MLIHEYDAVKRHEYYMRNRKLKGRKKAAAPVANALARKAKEAAAKKAASEKRRRALVARVAELKGKLERLQAALKLLTEAAQKRSGVQKNTAEKYESTKSTRSDPTSKYQKTASEKAAAAKASKKYYDENKDQSLPEQVKSLTEKIKTIQERIAKLRKTGSVGARNSNTK